MLDMWSMLLGIGCTKNGINDYVKTEHDYRCGSWLPEGTKDTVTDYSEISDGTSWADNEYLKG